MPAGVRVTQLQPAVGSLVSGLRIDGKLLGEEARVAIRHVRRDGMDAIKKLEKEIGKDEIERLSDQIQKATDQTIVEIDQLLAGKEKEIMQV
jgi:ribosome recycling factor